MSPQTCVFTYANYALITRVKYVGIPQGWALSPILFNLCYPSNSKYSFTSYYTFLCWCPSRLPCWFSGYFHNFTHVSKYFYHAQRARSSSPQSIHSQIVYVPALFFLKPFYFGNATIVLYSQKIPLRSHKYLGITWDNRLAWNAHNSNAFEPCTFCKLWVTS